jgi:hypothetical protein
MSRYTIFGRVATDAKTAKDTLLAVHDEQVVPQLDEAGHIQLDKNNYPVILLREGIEHKQFRRDPITTLDKQAYEWSNQHIWRQKASIRFRHARAWRKQSRLGSLWHSHSRETYHVRTNRTAIR